MTARSFTAPDPESLTMGCEEEFQIVDPSTAKLASRADKLKRDSHLKGDLAPQNELHLSQIETATSICGSLGEVREQLGAARRDLLESASHFGLTIGAAGTHAFSDWHDQPVTPKKRYLGMVTDYQYLTRELLIFGQHVHVGIADPDLAVQVMNRSRVYLPTLLALTASSPYWLGEDTGYDSFRMLMWLKWPMTGPPQPFKDRADYDRTIDGLVRAGVISDGSKVYWDVRIPRELPTVEFRVSDVSPRLDDAVMLAGLVRAIALRCARAAADGEPDPNPRPELLKAASWRAARSGVNGELVDVAAGRKRPAAELVEGMLGELADELNDLGEGAFVRERVREILDGGNSADRQRAAVQRSGEVRSAVDLVVRETAEL
ncbi:carboxylate-amine ligase [Alienimonas californiensis]|uniref:Putative glutamate--cysteine ligase 2 n=1 Tax=Alienimonas californiensis TaxID=2527989 RepID=A0A517P5P0_9PLAN|nr:glutamate--cysteine ligase [Alienimonas californiensis]QDT14681.1 Carboxylate-amine ligase YbdK [Alienimonas californiensis]